jgi:hypothetical protein
VRSISTTLLLAAQINVDLQDLEEFLETFFPVTNVPKSLVEKYPVCLRISVSTVVNDPVEADILPLIKLLIASPNIDPSYVVSQDLDQALPANFIEDDEIEIKAAGDLNSLIARLDPQPWDESVFIKPYISDYLTAPSYWLPRDGVAIATHLVKFV